MLRVVLWIFVAFLLYAYVGYFVVLLVISGAAQCVRSCGNLLGRGADTRVEEREPPRVSLLVAAYNEEQVIGERIRNALASRFPRDRLEIVIASDGSDDRTAEIVRGFCHEGVRLLEYPERAGKVSVLNRSIPQCSGEVVVLSDANTKYDPDAVARLVRHFADERVGVVVGEMRLGSPDDSYKAEKRYWQYELMLKLMEGRLGVAFGVGGIYAIRRSLFRPVPSNTITEDFVIPMNIRAGGARMVYEPGAVAYEDTAKNVMAEATRRVRIATGNYQSIWRCRALLNPLRGWIAFCFWSHKVVRWAAPFALAGLLGVNAALAARPGWYRWALAVQTAFYAMALMAALVRRPRWLRRAFGLPYYFTVMNVSMLRGFWRCLLGRQAVAWKRTER